MSIPENQRRIVKTRQALRLLASGKPLRRGEMFPKKPKERYENWINNLLNRLIELGIAKAHGKSFSRYYQLAKDVDRYELRQHAEDDVKVAQLLWPGTAGADPYEEPEPEAVAVTTDTDTEADDEPTQEEINAIVLRLMGGVVEKLDRMEHLLAECHAVLQEFKS